MPTQERKDDDIAALYRGPLREFTAARNALAKRSGDRGAAIRTLEKPTLAAWAVNQVYWHRRPAFDALIAAAAARRRAFAQTIAGRKANVDAADAVHRMARDRATVEARRLIEDARESASAATMAAVNETLDALPGSATPGRLTHPLKLTGFEALAGLVPSSRTPESGGARGVAVPERAVPAPAHQGAAAGRARDAARRGEIAAARRALREAQQAVRRTQTALEAARRALATANAARDRLHDEWRSATERADAAAAQCQRREHEATDARDAEAQRQAAVASFESPTDT